MILSVQHPIPFFNRSNTKALWTEIENDNTKTRGHCVFTTARKGIKSLKWSGELLAELSCVSCKDNWIVDSQIIVSVIVFMTTNRTKNLTKVRHELDLDLDLVHIRVFSLLFSSLFMLFASENTDCWLYKTLSIRLFSAKRWFCVLYFYRTCIHFDSATVAKEILFANVHKLWDRISQNFQNDYHWKLSF